jgi:PAS domain S-box-containing protein
VQNLHSCTFLYTKIIIINKAWPLQAGKIKYLSNSDIIYHNNTMDNINTNTRKNIQHGGQPVPASKIDSDTIKLHYGEIMADIVQNSANPIAMANAQGAIVMCNHSFARLTGYSEKELLGLNWTHDLTPVEWHDKDEKVLEQLRNMECQQVRYEKQYLRKDGTRVLWNYLSNPLILWQKRDLFIMLCQRYY